MIPAARPLDHLTAGGAPSDIAIVLRSETLTYCELDRRVGLMAGWLAQRFDLGDRIASWAAKNLTTCLLPLACARAGLVHVPINPVLKHAQAAHILADSGARFLVGNDARLRSLHGRDVPVNCTIETDARFVEQAIAHGHHLHRSNHDPESLAAILYTSGSTGMPKGVMLSHANMWLGAVSVARYLELGAQDRVLGVLPLAFDYGQNQLFSTWYAGGTVIPYDYLMAKDVAKACERHRVTTLAGVPPLWSQLLEAEWSDAAKASLRRLTNSGGALTETMVWQLRETFPNADLYPMYGLTEAFRSTYLPPRLVDEFPTSMGKAVPHAEVLVVRPDGSLAADGEEGELVHCGPLVAQGYWQDARRTAKRFRPAPAASRYGGTAVWSGDTVRREANDLLYFVARSDAMIKTAGNRVSPQEIEVGLIASGMVSDTVAFGAPDDRLGQAVHAAIVPIEGKEISDRQLLDAARVHLPNYMLPKYVHSYLQFPLNPNGKIDRARIILECLEGIGKP